MSVRVPPAVHKPAAGVRAFEPIKTPGKPHGIENEAATRLHTVSDQDLDLFLKARARKLGGPQQRGGLVASLQNLIAPPKTALDPRVGQMKHELSSTLDSLGKVYADGWVTEFEVGALMHARDRLAAVLRLAEPDVLMMLPKDVRQRLEAQLFAPVQVLHAAAERRSARVWSDVEARDRGALEKKLAAPLEHRRLDMNVLARTEMSPSSLERYVPGDLIAVPRSDGTFTKGVVVANLGDRLEVQMLTDDGSFAKKSLSAADVARANPLKIGDTFRAGKNLEQTIYVNGLDKHGLIGAIDRGDGKRVGMRGPEMSQHFEATASRYRGQTIVASALATVPGYLTSPPHVQRMLRGLLALKGDPVFDKAADELSRLVKSPELRALPPQAQADRLLDVLRNKDLLHSVIPNFGARRENLSSVSYGTPRWEDGARHFRMGNDAVPRAAVYPLTMTVGAAQKGFAVVMPESWPDAQRLNVMAELVGTLQRLPPESLTSVQSIVMNPVRNPSDSWFAKQFNIPDFRSAMTAGGDARQIHVYPSTSVATALQSFVHEVGHLVSMDAFRSVDSSTPEWDVWRNAVQNDVIAVSRYAKGATHEDFAETYSLYMSTKGTPRHDEYRALMPWRFAILDEMARQAGTA